MIEKSDVNIVLAFTLTEDAIPLWWDAPVNALQGMTPSAAWEAGKREDVIKVATSYLEPVYG